MRYDPFDKLFPYNVHLHQEERALSRQMQEAWDNGEKEKYQALKKKWFNVVDKQMANIERHEPKEHIDKLWNAQKEQLKGL